MSYARQTKARSPHHSTNPPAHRDAPGQERSHLLGNQIMQALQPKLEVNAPGDAYEHEADNMASRVTSMSEAQVQRETMKAEDDQAVQRKPLASQVTPLVQRKIEAPKEDKKKKDEGKSKPAQRMSSTGRDEGKEEEVAQTKRADPQQTEDKKDDQKQAQRKTEKADGNNKDDKKKKDENKPVQKAGGPGSGVVAPNVERDIESMQRGGRPLDSATRGYFEPRFGADFSNVRVHDDAESARAAQSLNAQAFTQGEHIFFGAGQYQPNDTPGRQLMAHELTHTLQQGAATAMPGTAQAKQVHLRSNVIQRAEGDEQEIGDEENDTVPESVPEYTTSGGNDDRFRSLFETIRQIGGSFDTRTGHYFAAGSGDGLLFDTVQVPAFKLTFPGVGAYGQRYGSNYGQFGRVAGYGRRGQGQNPGQRAVWHREVSESGLRDRLDAKLRQSVGNNPDAFAAAQAKPIRLIRVPVQGSRGHTQGSDNAIYIFGTTAPASAPNSVFRRLQIPNWGRGTESSPPPARQMQVDHVVELQIGNWRTHDRANAIENMVLLDRGPNAASGDFIRTYINGRIRRFLEAVNASQTEQLAATPAPTRPGRRRQSETPRTQLDEAIDAIKRHFHIEFDGVQGASGGGVPRVSRDHYWTRTEIEAGEPLAAARVSSYDRLEDALGSRDEVYVFTRRTGGRYKSFRWPDHEQIRPDEANWLRPFTIRSKEFPGTTGDVNEQANFGRLNVNLAEPPLEGQEPGGQRNIEFSFDVERISTARYAGYINKDRVLGVLRRNARRLGIPGMSPINIDEFDLLDSGLYLRGRILPSIPILRGAEIDFEVEGSDLRVFKTFTASEVTVPAPLRISGAALTVAAGTRSGLSARGNIDFGIDRVGTGFLEARARTGTGGAGRQAAGFSLAGGFDFDTRLFDPARITMRYEDGEFSGQGQIGIPPGRVTGIQRANLTMSYGQGRFEAAGDVELSAPGMQRGSLNVTYSEQEGLVIAGTVQLAPNPAIRSGSLEARVERKPDGSWKVAARGTAEPAVPGINSRLNVAYDDGLFDAEVTASYARGMLNGQMRAAATNRPIDPVSGQPQQGAAPTDNVTVYGAGQVTVRFSPWLQGTVGIRLLPNGEIELSGQVSLPSAVNLFDARRYDRNLLRINIDIPIVGLSVAGARVGIFATIGGGLDLTAGIGPGQLRDLSLGVTYNPSHEDQTHVTGHGELYIPADAGLRLFVRGGIGAGIPLVSATAGVEVGGQIGLQGAARAAVDIDWTPTRGLVVDAVGEIFVEPRFTFDVSAYVEVTLDLLIDTVELYSKRWRLASFTYGSNLRFGVRFPIHYEENQPFALSMDNLEFTVPEIDPESVIAGILESV